MSIIYVAAMAAFAAGPQGAETPPSETTELASETLAQGNAAGAIATLEHELKFAPRDPALLINLGIAYAQQGDDERARDLFQQALLSSQPIELETADGRLTDSRRLARKALRMLESGAFADAGAALSRRD